MIEDDKDIFIYRSLKNKEIMGSSTENINIQFQRKPKYNKLLPYVNDLEAESQALLAEIKANLGRAIILREMQPGCVLWITRLCE